MRTNRRAGHVVDELVSLIGEAAMIALAENFGGNRLYVANKFKEDGELVSAIGIDAAAKISQRFAPDVIDVPVSRDLRAAHYREQGLTHAQIARKLGITESGVEKMMRKLKLTSGPTGGERSS